VDVPDAPRPDDRRPADWSEVALALGLIAGLVVLLSIDVSGPVPDESSEGLFEGTLRTVVGYLASGAEIVAALVIGWGVVHAAVGYAARTVGRGPVHRDGAEGVRLRLGRTLALGLEFTLAADILGTAVAPTRADILTLAAVTLLRTLLNLFLEREIRNGEARHGEGDRASAAGTPVPDGPVAG
jgi:uncharacterized membrane protein